MLEVRVSGRVRVRVRVRARARVRDYGLGSRLLWGKDSDGRGSVSGSRCLDLG